MILPGQSKDSEIQGTLSSVLNNEKSHPTDGTGGRKVPGRGNSTEGIAMALSRDQPCVWGVFLRADSGGVQDKERGACGGGRGHATTHLLCASSTILLHLQRGHEWSPGKHSMKIRVSVGPRSLWRL